MAYALTQKDLQDLASQGVNIDGIPEGAEATAEEMSLLNVQPTPAPTADAPATGAPAGLTPTQQSYNAARAQGVEPENAPQSGGIPVTTPTPSPAMGAGGMGGGIMDLLSQPISQDPFENLSRSQRTMIGFAALKDAGMALQGKEGGAVRGVMEDITARADMERKRQAALARQQAMASLFGGGAVGGGSDLASRKQAILNGMTIGIIEPAAGNAALAEINRELDKQNASTSAVGAGAGALDDVDRLRGILKEGGSTGFMGFLFSQLPATKASYARDVATSLRSGMALGALKELKAGGATLGSVSEKELELLEGAITRLNLNATSDQVKEQLAAIEGHYKDAIRMAYGKASDEEKSGFDRFFGGATPSWVLDPSEQPPAPTGTTTDDLTPAERKRLNL